MIRPIFNMLLIFSGICVSVQAQEARAIQAQEVRSVDLLVITPEMRGRLIELYDSDDQRGISQLAVRLVDKNQRTQIVALEIPGGGPSNPLIENLFLPTKIAVHSLESFAQKVLTQNLAVQSFSLKLSEQEVFKFSQSIAAIKKTSPLSENQNSARLFQELLTDALDSSRTTPGTNSGLYRGNRRAELSRQRAQIVRLEKNAMATEKVLELKGIKIRSHEWRFEDFRAEICLTQTASHCPTRQLLKQLELDSAAETLPDLLRQFVEARKERGLLYLHKGQREELAAIAREAIAIDNEFLKSKADSTKRMAFWSDLIDAVSYDYEELRFLEEGSFDKTYPRDLISKAFHFVRPFADEQLKERTQALLDTSLDHLGNHIVRDSINVLGQVFKKRKWVPYLRIAANFRENHLTGYRQRVLTDLFSEGGMKPGDIILEKDMQANTDLLIPGYWVHTSIYYGTIKELKQLGVWDSPDFANSRAQIEDYRNNPDKRNYLKNELGNTLPFDDVPWFIESDRPGVGIHPLLKFLQTDGMAVLRPTSNWGPTEIAAMMKRADAYMHFQYDYVHNVKNQFYVTCSKFALKVFDQITFPVSKSGPYISVSPDQIGQPVSADPTRPDSAELKLIIFLDAHQKGQMTFHHQRPETYSAYPTYLEGTGFGSK
jgi:hypothetical protein